MIQPYTTKPLEIRDIAEFAKFANVPELSNIVSNIANYLGAAKEYSDRIVVHLNFSVSESTREAVFVHEVLHIVLRYEGFPGIVTRADSIHSFPPNLIPKLEFLTDFFRSTVEHLRVYNRMQTDFTLDFTPYFEEEVQTRIRRFSKFPYKNSPRNAKYYYCVQQDILDGLNYYQFPEPFSQRILTVFKDTDPDGFSSCSALYGKLSKIGFSTPQQMFKCANLIKDQIVKYGERKSIGSRNSFWRAIHIVEDAKEIPLEDWRNIP